MSKINQTGPAAASRPLFGKLALVTGASRGIGRAIAIALAAEGASLIVHYGANRDEADETLARVRELGVDGFALPADLGQVTSIRGFYDQLDAELGQRQQSGRRGFDILVNNAGVNLMAPFEDTTEEAFDRVFAVNVKGTFFFTQLALPRLRDGGRIVTLSSGLTRFVPQYPGFVAYAMAKAGLQVLTHALAAQLGPRGITVNAILPGAVDTDINASWLRGNADAQAQTAKVAALGRVAQPDDIARVAALLAGPGAGWVTGQMIEASGGAHL